MTKYPLFIPPEPIGSKSAHELIKKEADLYFHWMMKVMDKRIFDLLSRYKEDVSGSSEDLLLRLGEKITADLKSAEFSQQEGDNIQLTSAGYALAADMGLLLAKLFQRDCGKSVQWTIQRKPKSDVSYNCPVLTGFGTVTLDPIHLSIVQASGVADGTWNSDAWHRVFTIWKSDVTGK